MNFKKIIFAIAMLGFAFSACTKPSPNKTIENLKAGIKGETTASAKYAEFAKKANEEGFASIAKLFEAASKAESIHAANHRKVLEELGGKMESFKPEFDVKTTAENLKAAIEGETYEVTTMYPQFLNDANLEKADKAVKSFTWAVDTEKKHAEFYRKALESLTAQTLTTLPAGYAVCPICGNTYDIIGVDANCAFCQTSKEKFISFK